jgi:hypothetical protein
MTEKIQQNWTYQEGISPFGSERALILDRNLFTAPREVTSLFGAVAFCDPVDRRTLSLNRTEAAGFDRIVFANPYGTSESKNIYDCCRGEGFPILVCERGLLPGTVMLDQSGFLADSLLFDPDLVAGAQPVLPKQTLGELRRRFLNRPALEPQMSQSCDLETLESRLESPAPSARPTVLIALQQSQDTAVRFFGFQGRSYGAFLRFAEELCESYSTVCDFTFKPHPREPNAAIAGARSVGHLHIVEAIMEASHVMCFSSGVGLLALLLQRSVGYFGVPLYHQCAAAQAVRSSDDFDRFLLSSFVDKQEIAASYLNYLDTVYSHADFFGRSVNRFSNRDIYAYYKRVRIASDTGVYNHVTGNESLLNPTYTWPLRALSRSLRNRLKIGFHAFSEN